MKAALHLTIDVLPYAVYERGGDPRLIVPADLFTVLKID